MNRILLVSMPFGSAKWPSAGLGLLQAIVTREGMPCDCRYLNLLFARRISYEAYEHVCTQTADTLVGEWVFAKALFADRIPPLEDYALKVVCPSIRDAGWNPSARASKAEIEDETTRWLRLLLEQARDFLDECLQAVPWEEYALVGFTTSFQQTLASLALAHRLKQRYPSIQLAFGGAGCEGEMGLALHRLFPAVDFVCRGEADTSFPRLARAVLSGESTAGIPGVLHRAAIQAGAPAPDAERISNLDRLPYPDYSAFVGQRARDLPKAPPAQLLIETARGCWWGERSHCTFCGLNQGALSFRRKSPERAIDELSHLRKSYGVRAISACDSIIDMGYFTTLLPRLAELHLDLELFYETKANLRKAQVKLLKEAGVVRIQPGIESLSTAVLRRMRKGVSASQNVQLLRWCAEYDLTPVWNILAGFPGEAPAEYVDQAHLVPLLVHLPPPSGAAVLRLDRHSPLFVGAGTNGISRVRPKPAYRYIYPLSEREVSELAYSFDFDYDDGRNPDAYLAELNREVAAWNRVAGRCSLSSLSLGDELHVLDTRPVAGAPGHVLRGLRRAVYEYCDSARSHVELEAYVRRQDGNRPEREVELDEILSELVEEKLLVNLDGRYLSLSVSADFQASQVASCLAAGVSPPRGFAPLIERLYASAPELVLEVCRRMVERTQKSAAPHRQPLDFTGLDRRAHHRRTNSVTLGAGDADNAGAVRGRRGQG